MMMNGKVLYLSGRRWTLDFQRRVKGRTTDTGRADISAKRPKGLMGLKLVRFTGSGIQDEPPPP
jgi:hypothetical protein